MIENCKSLLKTGKNPISRLISKTKWLFRNPAIQRHMLLYQVATYMTMHSQKLLIHHDVDKFLQKLIAESVRFLPIYSCRPKIYIYKRVCSAQHDACVGCLYYVVNEGIVKVGIWPKRNVLAPC